MMEDNQGVPASPSGCQPTASAADASSQGGIPNAVERQGRRFLAGLADAYPFRIEGPDTICGFEGDRHGPCISRPFPAGRRTWAFENEADRDAFASAIEARRAVNAEGGAVEDESAAPKEDAHD